MMVFRVVSLNVMMVFRVVSLNVRVVLLRDNHTQEPKNHQRIPPAVPRDAAQLTGSVAGRPPERARAAPVVIVSLPATATIARLIAASL